MKYIKLFEELRNDEERLKSLVNQDLINFIHDLFLEYMDNGSELELMIYYCSDNGSKDLIYYGNWYEHIQREDDWMTKYARIDKDYNKDKLLYKIGRSNLSDIECDELLDIIKSNYTDNVEFDVIFDRIPYFGS
jgi:hypothetical protein